MTEPDSIPCLHCTLMAAAVKWANQAAAVTNDNRYLNAIAIDGVVKMMAEAVMRTVNTEQTDKFLASLPDKIREEMAALTEIEKRNTH